MSDDGIHEHTWEGILQALEKLYGSVEPQHFAALPRYWEGGNNPLDGVSAYVADNPEHWHYIGFGLSDPLKGNLNSKSSGLGFELTFRLVRNSNDVHCPFNGINMLQNLAKYVVERQCVFSGYHYIPNGMPIFLNSPDMTAFVFSSDPELPEIGTPWGAVKFIQVLCITEKELKWIEKHSTEGFIKRYTEMSPLLISDLNRQSIIA